MSVVSERATAVSSDAKREFDRDGYVVLRGFFSPAEVADIRANVERYVREIGPNLPPGEVMYEDKDRPETLKRLAHVDQHDAWFREFLHAGTSTALAELLLGGPVVGKQLAWFNKTPGDSTVTPAHQDGYYFMLEPQEALTMWLALDDVDEGNGCLRYVPGSHRRGMRPHARTQIVGFSQGISDYGDTDRAAEAPVTARPGDLLVHHSLTIHSADANSSERRQRRSLGLIYYSASARQDAEGLEAYRQKLMDDWQKSRKI
jgi:phytanoyl-CoA hydroxylase